MDFSQQIIIVQKIAEKYFSERRERFSIAALERFLGVAQNMWRYWKKGGKPRLEDAEKISRKLGISPRWLLLGEGEPLDQGPEPTPAHMAHIPPATNPTSYAKALARWITGHECDIRLEFPDTPRGEIVIHYSRKGEAEYSEHQPRVEDGPSRVQDEERTRKLRMRDPPDDDDLPSSAAVNR